MTTPLELVLEIIPHECSHFYYIIMATHTHTIPPWEDQCEWHRMIRMTGPDCAVMCNLINTHTHTINTHTHTHTNHVDLESFSSRCWTFRRTHTSADPIRVLCTRLALSLTLSLTSRLAPCARLTVDVPTRTFWLAGIFLRRKKRCAGVVGTRTDWVLKGEEGGRTTPLLQYVARFDEGGEIFGFGGGGYKESWSWCSLFVEHPSLFVATSGEKPALRFRPRAVVAGRGVVAVYTRISSQEYVYDK